ncbi:hypothetical protein Ciccas_007392 [Cichlidogyrus casuarinus]|uniref:Tetraspanin n=1 Tax=Cichlidogyrus casuarinus TaxID=1844966 RepID=A0ABD2Q318_9PLAT
MIQAKTVARHKRNLCAIHFSNIFFVFVCVLYTGLALSSIFLVRGASSSLLSTVNLLGPLLLGFSLYFGLTSLTALGLTLAVFTSKFKVVTFCLLFILLQFSLEFLSVACFHILNSLIKQQISRWLSWEFIDDLAHRIDYRTLHTLEANYRCCGWKGFWDYGNNYPKTCCNNNGKSCFMVGCSDKMDDLMRFAYIVSYYIAAFAIVKIVIIFLNIRHMFTDLGLKPVQSRYVPKLYE